LAADGGLLIAESASGAVSGCGKIIEPLK
jgi:hypothetical protein